MQISLMVTINENCYLHTSPFLLLLPDVAGASGANLVRLL